MNFAMKAAATLSAAALLSTGVAGTANAMVARDATETFGRLTALNSSGVRGSAEAISNGRKLVVDVDARRVLKNMPHAQHIHFGAKARHECPTINDDSNGDSQITTTEGVPQYGPVRISLTTRGGTGPKSALAVNRFPTAPRGVITYNRTLETGSRVAEAIRRGDAVYVLHGVDYNGNGKYDFRGNGKSDLDPSLPAEATDLAACTVLRVQN